MLTFHSIFIFFCFIIFTDLIVSINILKLFSSSINMMIVTGSTFMVYDLRLKLGEFMKFITNVLLIFMISTLKLDQVY